MEEMKETEGGLIGTMDGLEVWIEEISSGVQMYLRYILGIMKF